MYPIFPPLTRRRKCGGESPITAGWPWLINYGWLLCGPFAWDGKLMNYQCHIDLPQQWCLCQLRPRPLQAQLILSPRMTISTSTPSWRYWPCEQSFSVHLIQHATLLEREWFLLMNDEVSVRRNTCSWSISVMHEQLQHMSCPDCGSIAAQHSSLSSTAILGSTEIWRTTCKGCARCG